MYECDIPHKAYFVTALIKSEYYDICSFMHPIKTDMFLILPSVLNNPKHNSTQRLSSSVQTMCYLQRDTFMKSIFSNWNDAKRSVFKTVVNDYN